MQMRIQIRQPRPAVRTAKLCVGRRTAGIRRTGVSAGVSTRSAGRFSGRRAGKAEGGNGLHIHLESIWMSNVDVKRLNRQRPLACSMNGYRNIPLNITVRIWTVASMKSMPDGPDGADGPNVKDADVQAGTSLLARSR